MTALNIQDFTQKSFYSANFHDKSSPVLDIVKNGNIILFLVGQHDVVCAVICKVRFPSINAFSHVISPLNFAMTIMSPPFPTKIGKCMDYGLRLSPLNA